ncbi:hypothetical protein DSM03_1011086 [Leeuwenhoekiella aestuarii]|uniref:Uncharacterized protein n=1 Tax=Leeuwenhoekiella aestuarii TaxID=2249426 RepID=A0A4Q0NZK2_9FLAO|nr:hypothetical protein [Leeuwenhoekiella aestuarii]RXG18403.1 hypothetical protein DSM04_101596 [Leeuwenhoekiella aestuarii]RXG19709.1 hypothetical protein DSM03_1011086 [Leeuwenhoekiella aestuarii]
MKNLNGTWLKIKTGADYCRPEFIEFSKDQIIHFKLELKSGNELLKVRTKWSEKLSEYKYEFVNDNRIRILRMGKTHTVLSETESKTEDTEFATDYERIEPTKTELESEKIETLEFKAEWSNEKIPLKFNEILDSPVIQEINKRMKRSGRKLILENFQGTYFASIFDNDERDKLIGIKEIDEEKAILFGFPEKPYEIKAE